MDISFENVDGVNGLLTIKMGKADYEEQVEKTLKDYCKKAKMPGFRPGKVPMSIVKKQFGNEAKGLDRSYLEVGEPVLIKISGELDSLNLDNAVSIGLYELSKAI